MLLVFSLFFHFTSVRMTEYGGAQISSLFGPVPINLVVYFSLFCITVWVSGWAILWGRRESARPKALVLWSWAIPLAIVYVWVSLSLLLVAGVQRWVMNLVSFVPPLLIAVLVPQAFLSGVLDRREKNFALAAVGLGVTVVALWGVGTTVGRGVLPFVEFFLPSYFGVLTVEYLCVHRRVNGPSF
jgi:hypothetical protein